MGARELTARSPAFVAVACAALVACSGGGARSNGAGDPARAGAETGGAGASAAAEPTVVDLAGARAALGRRGRVAGTAQNAKLAAAIVGDELLIYCLDRDSWPSDVVGTRIVVIGTIEWTEQFAAQTSPTGEISAGTDGGVFVIRHCAPSSGP